MFSVYACMNLCESVHAMCYSAGVTVTAVTVPVLQCWCYRAAAAAAVPGLYAAVPGVTVTAGVTGLLLLPLYLVFMLLYPVLQWLLVLQACCCRCTWSVCCCTRCYSGCWCYRAAAAAVPGLYAAVPGVTVAVGITGLLLLLLYLVCMLLYPVLQ